MAAVVALLDDLFFRARVQETARHAGITVEFVSTPEALAERARQASARLYLIDLNARGNPLDAIARLRTQDSHTPVVGFLAHVQGELAERARSAGCSVVLPRSQFTRELPGLLQRLQERNLP
ncbi:MAG: response regulator [Acidobacteriia bacterium]|nr:response regulator [Terriglobia bacterium]